MSKNQEKLPKIPLNIYVEHFISKYRVLSLCDLTILVAHASKSQMPFNRVRNYISIALGKLKKEGKVLQVKQGHWGWKTAEESYD